MAKKASSGKRHAIGAEKRSRWKSEGRRKKNKIRRLKQEIKRCENILKRNPDAGVATNIADLNKKLKEVSAKW